MWAYHLNVLTLFLLGNAEGIWETDTRSKSVLAANGHSTKPP